MSAETLPGTTASTVVALAARTGDGARRGRAPVRVVVHGGDPLTRAGMVGLLRGSPGLQAVPEDDGAPADIALVAVESMTRQVVTLLRVLGRMPGLRLAVVVGEISDEAITLAVQAGAVGLLRRRDATRESLAQLVRSVAAGDAVVPPDVLATLIPRERGVGGASGGGTVARLLALNGTNDREIDVLRLLGEGADTREIARRMCYSERTVKTIIQDVVRRFGARNRTHAVAYAVRHGII